MFNQPVFPLFAALILLLFMVFLLFGLILVIIVVGQILWGYVKDFVEYVRDIFAFLRDWRRDEHEDQGNGNRMQR